MIVFDLTKMNTVLNVRRWMSLVLKHAPENVPCVLVGTKLDQARVDDQRQIEEADARELAAEYNMEYFETSALLNIGITEAMEHLKMRIF